MKNIDGDETSLSKSGLFETGIEALMSLPSADSVWEITSINFSGSDIRHDIDTVFDERIREILSSSGLPIISEEDNYDDHHLALPDSLFWLIDPVDGTHNFARKLPHFASSIALMKGRNPIFGAVLNLSTRDLYSGGPKFGSQLNGTTIRAAAEKPAGQSILATGVPLGMGKRTFRIHFPGVDVEEIGKVRMFGCASLSLCYLAEGKVDYYAEEGIFLWDVAAAAAIALGAGATVRFDRHRRLRVNVFAGPAQLRPF